MDNNGFTNEQSSKLFESHIVEPHVDLSQTWPPDQQQWFRRDLWGWDSNHVRMPCSMYNTFTNSNSQKQTRWSLIRQMINQIGIFYTCKQLELLIQSYNKKYTNIWKFSALEKFYNQNEQLFKETIPEITKLALELPELISRPIPLLRQNKELSLSLSQIQIASLLANAFLCTFPWRNDTRSPSSEYSNFPNINFSSLFQNDTQMNVEKIKCIFSYFKRVGDKSPEGVVTFTRKVLDDTVDWKKSEKTLCALDITSSGSIEADGEGMLQVDFANKLVGGGVIGRGCIQEEIRFVINPELIVSRLFTEKLLDNEALVITGSERFNQYTGYSRTFKWKSDFIDKTPFDENNRRKCLIIAIDARDYKHKPSEQYSTRSIERDLNKAYVGFYNKDVGSTNLLPVATGNWGCGAFKGDPTLKALIQWMAASQAGRTIKYFTFRDYKMEETARKIFHILNLNEARIGHLYWILYNYHKSGTTLRLDLFFQECDILELSKTCSSPILEPKKPVISPASPREVPLPQQSPSDIEEMITNIVSMHIKSSETKAVTSTPLQKPSHHENVENTLPQPPAARSADAEEIKPFTKTNLKYNVQVVPPMSKKKVQDDDTSPVKESATGTKPKVRTPDDTESSEPTKDMKHPFADDKKHNHFKKRAKPYPDSRAASNRNHHQSARIHLHHNSNPGTLATVGLEGAPRRPGRNAQQARARSASRPRSNMTVIGATKTSSEKEKDAERAETGAGSNKVQEDGERMHIGKHQSNMDIARRDDARYHWSSGNDTKRSDGHEGIPALSSVVGEMLATPSSVGRVHHHMPPVQHHNYPPPQHHNYPPPQRQPFQQNQNYPPPQRQPFQQNHNYPPPQRQPFQQNHNYPPPQPLQQQYHQNQNQQHQQNQHPQNQNQHQNQHQQHQQHQLRLKEQQLRQQRLRQQLQQAQQDLQKKLQQNKQQMQEQQNLQKKLQQNKQQMHEQQEKQKAASETTKGLEHQSGKNKVTADSSVTNTGAPQSDNPVTPPKPKKVKKKMIKAASSVTDITVPQTNTDSSVTDITVQPSNSDSSVTPPPNPTKARKKKVKADSPVADVTVPQSNVDSSVAEITTLSDIDVEEMYFLHECGSNGRNDPYCRICVNFLLSQKN